MTQDPIGLAIHDLAALDPLLRMGPAERAALHAADEDWARAALAPIPAQAPRGPGHRRRRAPWAAPALAGLGAVGVVIAIGVMSPGGDTVAPSAPGFGVVTPPGMTAPRSSVPISRAVSTTAVRSSPAIEATTAESAAIVRDLASFSLTSPLQEIEVTPEALSVRLNAPMGAPSAIATWEGSVVAAALAADPAISARRVDVQNRAPDGDLDTPLAGDVDLPAARALAAGDRAIDEAVLRRDAAAAGLELLGARPIGALGAVSLTVRPAVPNDASLANESDPLTALLKSLAGRPYLVAVVDAAGQGLSILSFNPVVGAGRGTGSAWAAPEIAPPSFGAFTPRARP